MSPISPSADVLDCVVVGHHDVGFAPHEQLLRLRGVHSGAYRNLRMDFVRFDGAARSYLDVLNVATGQALHWTELPQLAPMYLCSFLTRRGYTARAASFYPARRLALEELVGRARVVAITTTLYLDPLAASQVVARLRAINPDSHLVIGGPLVDNLHFRLDEDDFQWVLTDIGADSYVLERQGEHTLADLVGCLRDGGAPAGVPNCYVREEGRYVFTGPAPEDNSLDACGVDWDLFTDTELGPTVQTRTARSCAFSCSFCDYPTRAGPLNLASLSTVEQELRALSRRGVRNLVFIDDTFNVPAARFKALCQMMIDNRFNFQWYSYFRCANARDEETFDLMAASGCRGVFLGIESGSNLILRNMHKAATLEQYRWGMAQLARRNIVTFASFIVGFPGETRATVREMIDFVNETRPTFFRGELWFYNHRSPVHLEHDRFGLHGEGHQWRHATMDWTEGSDLVEQLFDQVTGSTWLPMYDMDFWILPYLEGKGVELGEFQRFVQHCNQLLAVELGTPSSLGPGARNAIEARVRSAALGVAAALTASPAVARVG